MEISGAGDCCRAKTGVLPRTADAVIVKSAAEVDDLMVFIRDFKGQILNTSRSDLNDVCNTPFSLPVCYQSRCDYFSPTVRVCDCRCGGGGGAL